MAVTELLILLLAQVLADFLVRNDARQKNRHGWEVLVARACLMVFVVVSLDLALHVTLLLPFLAAAVAAHILVDGGSEAARALPTMGPAWLIPLEQLVHVLVNWRLTVMAFPPVQVTFADVAVITVPVPNIPQFWLATAILFVLSVVGGAYWIPALLDRIMGSRPTSQPGPADGKSDENYVRSGFWIGIFERVFLFLIVVFEQPVALGVLVALKSLARHKLYTDDPQFAERFLVGTLISFLVAMIPAGIVLTLYHTLL